MRSAPLDQTDPTVSAFQFADPRSERISAGPRHALRRAQQHHPGGGTEEAVVPEQATLADEQHRVRRQHTGRAHYTGDRRRETLESQSHRDCRVERRDSVVSSDAYYYYYYRYEHADDNDDNVIAALSCSPFPRGRQSLVQERAEGSQDESETERQNNVREAERVRGERERESGERLVHDRRIRSV